MPDVLAKENKATQTVKGSGTNYRRLVSFLRGSDEPVKRRNIGLYLGCSIRKVKKMAEAARNAGIPVGYSVDGVHGGLFLCKTPYELRKSIERIEGLALTLLDERRMLKNALVHMENKLLGKMF